MHGLDLRLESISQPDRDGGEKTVYLVLSINTTSSLPVAFLAAQRLLSHLHEDMRTSYLHACDHPIIRCVQCTRTCPIRNLRSEVAGKVSLEGKMAHRLLEAPQTPEAPAFSWACGEGREGGGGGDGAAGAWGPVVPVGCLPCGASAAEDVGGTDAAGVCDEAEAEGRRGRSQGEGRIPAEGHIQAGGRTREEARAGTVAVFRKGKGVAKGCGLRGRSTGHSRGPRREEGTGCGRHSNPA